MLADAMPEFIGWGQFLAYAAVAFGAVTWGIKQLMGTMTQTYGTIVAGLHAEVNRLTASEATKAQQIVQLEENVKECKKTHEDCEKNRIKMVIETEARFVQMTERLNAALLRVDLIEKKNGGPHEGAGSGRRPDNAESPVPVDRISGT